MPIGSITYHVDFAEIATVVFFVAFLAIVLFLRRKDKQEGYPLRASPFDRTALLGFPSPREDPTVYLLNEGGSTAAPHHYPDPPMAAEPLYPFDGTPLSPVGNPLLAALGPGAWVVRSDQPMLTEEGDPMLQPLRGLHGWSLEGQEADPRGMTVFDWRWREVGTVVDVWIDRSIKILRILEVDMQPHLASGARVLVPIFHTVVRERAREVQVTALDVHQFADIPRPAHPDRITAREDDRLNAYFAAGRFYRDAPPLVPRHGVRL